MPVGDIAEDICADRSDDDAETVDADRRRNGREPGSLKKTSPQTVAAITPVTRKSYCSITEPTMLASATLNICHMVGLVAASAICRLVGLATASDIFSPFKNFQEFMIGLAVHDCASDGRLTTTKLILALPLARPPHFWFSFQHVTSA